MKMGARTYRLEVELLSGPHLLARHDHRDACTTHTRTDGYYIDVYNRGVCIDVYNRGDRDNRGMSTNQRIRKTSGRLCGDFHKVYFLSRRLTGWVGDDGDGGDPTLQLRQGHRLRLPYIDR
jgi:hypothetical protein